MSVGGKDEVQNEDSHTPQEGSTVLLKAILPQKEVNKFEIRSDGEGLSQLAFHASLVIGLSALTLWSRSHGSLLFWPR